MRCRVLLIVAVALFAAAPCSAAGWLRASKRPTKSRATSRIPMSVLKSPEKMTERFGPSILAQEPANTQKPAKRFVTQP